MNDKVQKLTPEQKEIVIDRWKALQGLPSATEMQEAWSLRLKADSTPIEDLIEEMIPFDELKKFRKV